MKKKPSMERSDSSSLEVATYVKSGKRAFESERKKGKGEVKKPRKMKPKKEEMEILPQPSYIVKALVQMGLNADFVSEGLKLMDDDWRSQMEDEGKRLHIEKCKLSLEKLEFYEMVMAEIQSTYEEDASECSGLDSSIDTGSF